MCLFDFLMHRLEPACDERSCLAITCICSCNSGFDQTALLRHCLYQTGVSDQDRHKTGNVAWRNVPDNCVDSCKIMEEVRDFGWLSLLALEIAQNSCSVFCL